MTVKMKFIYKSNNKHLFWIIIRVISRIKRVYSPTFCVYTCENNLFFSSENVLKVCSSRRLWFWKRLWAFFRLIWFEWKISIICLFFFSVHVIKWTLLILFFSQLNFLIYTTSIGVLSYPWKNFNLSEFGNPIRWILYGIIFYPEIERSGLNMIDCIFFWRWWWTCPTP